MEVGGRIPSGTGIESNAGAVAEDDHQGRCAGCTSVAESKTTYMNAQDPLSCNFLNTGHWYEIR